MSQFIIGIDLGTTNIVVSYLKLSMEEVKSQIFKIPQIIEEGECEELATLPAFVYIPTESELTHGSLDLPWVNNRTFCIGAFARKKASLVPENTISSAKSWLCAANIERLSPILPWTQTDVDRKISPLEATRRYLEHIKDSWNHVMAGDKEENLFGNQQIIITVPASFDAAGRELTVKAAELAGFAVTLLEEPQAAFYAWLQDHDESWRELIAPKDRVLVCDVGGGTTDFSLIEAYEKNGDLALKRIAVGNHILLGGDNLDLALAFYLANKLKQEKGIQLDSYQITGLTHSCREAKETLSGNPHSQPLKITVLGRGSSVIGGSVTTELTHEELEKAILEGFFPQCNFDDTPVKQQMSGLREFGLNYESDPAITKHLAYFLNSHDKASEREDHALPTAILFNGGVSKSELLQGRIVSTLSGWLEDSASEITVLTGAHPDLAVAVGACWYGYVCQGNAIRVKAGSAQSYYIGIGSTMPAIPGYTPPLRGLCVVPFGMEEGSEVDIPFAGLGLVVGEATTFRFFATNNRKEDLVGSILDDIESRDGHELAALGAELPADDPKANPGTLVQIHLKSILTEIGTLQIWCIEENGNRKWKLEYELRAADITMNVP